jgi:hypothetical protein
MMAPEWSREERMRDTEEVALRILTAAIVIGSLTLIGAIPAAADRSALTFGSGASVQLADAGGSPADRDTYAQRARDEMQEWQHKLNDFSEKAEATGKEAGHAAQNDLNKAWTKAESASRELQTVAADGWERAKTSYEKATRELADAWEKIRSQNK